MSVETVERPVAATQRVMVLWCPDWPVVAASAAQDLPPEAPVAVIERGQVLACSATARADGVRRGMRKRDASATCPELVLIDSRPERDLRYFESVLTAIEEVSSSVSPIRPGLCATGVPSRFYGGEDEAAAVFIEHLVGAGVWDCRIGIADGIFTAEHAARRAAVQGCLVVPPGFAPEFLARLPIGVLDDADMVSLLRRLGIHRLGDFAALSGRDVLTRFGRSGEWFHRLARGVDMRVPARRLPPLELTGEANFDPPLETIEPIVFSSRQAAERCVADLAHHGLVCTSVTLEVRGDRGWCGTRTWAHSRWFAASDLIDRLYWQLQGSPAPEPVCGVRFVPEAVESLADQGEGLWGSAPDERLERGVARLQGMLGPEAVLAPAVQGGRTAQKRQTATVWGEGVKAASATSLPWPGSIPPPAPTRIFPEPKQARVVGPEGQPVAVTSRGLLTADPAHFAPEPGSRFMAITAWAGPWPIDELWWDEAEGRRVARFQVVGVDGSAWLLMLEEGRWWSEARYD